MRKKQNLKDCYARQRDDLQQIDTFIQNVTKKAYHNVYLISNPVLSRNPFASSLLHNFLLRNPARAINTFEVSWKLFQFYLKNSLYLINHALTWAAVQIFFRLTLDRTVNPVIIDNFLLVEPTLTTRCYDEKYFPGLQEVLLKLGRNVYIFPCFYGGVSLLSNGVSLLKIIRNSPAHIITEYDLLKTADFLSLIKFICFYPLAVIQLSRQIDNSNYLGKLLSAELLETLGKLTVHSHIRYLSGKRLACQFEGKATVISWFENQAQQKNFYRGLTSASQSSTIYACRSYIDFPAYLNSFVAESEALFGVIPDKILVNGSAYMKHSDKLEYRLGVSFRYKYLFDSPIGSNVHKTQCLLLLSFFFERNKEIINLCSASALARKPVKVRTHPTDTRSSQLVFPTNWVFDTSDKGSIFNDVAVIITSESGIAVEAAASGVSVIIVASQSSFTCNSMFDCGRGVIWDLAFDSTELDNAYERLIEQRTANTEEIKRVADWYKSSCFVEPTEENIIRAFDLK